MVCTKRFLFRINGPFFRGNLIFLVFRPFFTVWLGMAKLSQTLLIWSLNSQDMIRILKQRRHDFLGKHLCDEHCKDIMWCLCVYVKIHGFVNLFKNLLCKFVWILKTVIYCHVWNRGLQKVPCTVLLTYLHTFVFNILPVFNTLYLHNIGYWQVLFITYEQLGKS